MRKVPRPRQIKASIGRLFYGRLSSQSGMVLERGLNRLFQGQHTSALLGQDCRRKECRGQREEAVHRRVHRAFSC